MTFCGDYLIEFECPVCTEYMHPPIRQCIQGHSCCQSCFQKLQSCPTCRQNLNHRARCLATESMHAKLQFPCKNREFGCDVVTSGFHIRKHQNNCTFNLLVCPLKTIYKCNWIGTLNDIGQHCEAMHPAEFIKGTTQRFECGGILSLTEHRQAHLIFQGFGKLFKFVCEVNGDVICWSVFQLGLAKTKSKFRFAIEIENGNGDTFEMVECCHVRLPGDEDMFKNGKFVLVQTNSIESINLSDNLSYFLCISKIR